MNQSTPKPSIPLRDVLAALADLRHEEALVVTNQGSSRVWPLIAQHPLDFHFNPSTMGGAIPFGLGIALAQPQREVIVLTGDGSLLMSLGSLVSVISTRCTNLTIVLLDNLIYDVTGGQKTAASDLELDYLSLAKSLGFTSSAEFGNEKDWVSDLADFLKAPGPRWAWIHVDPALSDDMKNRQEPIDQQLARIRRELGNGDEGLRTND